MLPPRRTPRTDPPDYRSAAVMVLLFPEDGEVRFPLIVRCDAPGDVHAGQISLPGGSREADEDLITTALRETHEELGIEPARIEVVGTLSPHRIPVSGFEVLPVVGVTEGRPAMVPEVAEVDRIVVTSIEELEEPGRRTEFERTWSGQPVRIPAWRLDDGLLWGATAMILSELLAIVPARR